MTFVGEDLWILVGLVVLIGAIIRDYFNTSHSGPLGSGSGGSADGVGINHHTRTVDQARNFGARCKASHYRSAGAQHRDDPLCRLSRGAAHDSRLYPPPKGVILETLSDVQRYKAQVYAQSVSSHAMPPGNMTQMTPEERAILGHWLEKH